jgi:hypothetical protein
MNSERRAWIAGKNMGTKVLRLGRYRFVLAVVLQCRGDLGDRDHRYQVLDLAM